MAVFKLNICKFKNCDLVFNNLENLIRHIETNHIDFDPKIIEQFETQQPTCLPLSYVLRFFGDSGEDGDLTSHSKLKQTLLSPKPTIQQKRNLSDKQLMSTLKSTGETAQVISGCANTKNNNRGVKNFCQMKKSFKCHCGKACGTSHSLQKHAIKCHNAAGITAQMKEILQQGANGSALKKLIKPYRSISLKQISAAANPLKTLIVSTKRSSPTLIVPQKFVQQPQRLTIQLSDLNATSSS